MHIPLEFASLREPGVYSGTYKIPENARYTLSHFTSHPTLKTHQDANPVSTLAIFYCLFFHFLTYSPGSWKVVAKTQNNPQIRFTAEFKVKEYGKDQTSRSRHAASFSNWRVPFPNSCSVVPRLSVTLTPERSSFYVDDAKLTVNINAKWVKVFVFMDLNDSELKVSPHLLV